MEPNRNCATNQVLISVCIRLSNGIFNGANSIFMIISLFARPARSQPNAELECRQKNIDRILCRLAFSISSIYHVYVLLYSSISWYEPHRHAHSHLLSINAQWDSRLYHFFHSNTQQPKKIDDDSKTIFPLDIKQIRTLKQRSKVSEDMSRIVLRIEITVILSVHATRQIMNYIFRVSWANRPTRTTKLGQNWFARAKSGQTHRQTRAIIMSKFNAYRMPRSTNHRYDMPTRDKVKHIMMKRESIPLRYLLVTFLSSTNRRTHAFSFFLSSSSSAFGQINQAYLLLTKARPSNNCSF